MSVSVSTIESLLSSYPLGLMTAHQWYSDFPTNSNATFQGTGYFSGGDLPFGMIVELHDAPAGAAFVWRDSIEFLKPYGHIVNNAKILGGYSSTLPVEEFLVTRPAQLFMFHEPSTTSIIVETLGPAFFEIWGLYIDIPFVTPTQMTWNQTGTGETFFAPTIDGTVTAGLTDMGSLALDEGTVGVRVDIESSPDFLGSVEGDPVYVYDLGWINFGDSSAFETRQRVTGLHWEYLRSGQPPALVVSYSFSPMVVATITCLLANLPQP